MDIDDERDEELSSLTAIFPEIEVDGRDKHTFSLDLPVTPSQPLKVRFVSNADVENSEHTISHLPSLKLHMTLPEGYPTTSAPIIKLSTTPAWIPKATITSLEAEAAEIWERDGRSQMGYDYIDSLQQAAEQVFGLATENVLELSSSLKPMIVTFDKAAAKRTFDAETFDCGVCLDPKKGKDCHKMHKCEHVFCTDCLQGAYDAAIIGGDISSVKCLFPDCGVERDAVTKRATKAAPTLGPDELLEIPIAPPGVARYVKLKRKKRFESFPQTVYCPRKWCQGIARSTRYPKKPLENMTAADLEPESILAEKDAEPKDLRNNEDRLRICEDCDLAFCRVCLATWHGDYVLRCWPRTADELTEDELASRAYLLKNTSPCPSCSFAIQKSMGCNHITCFNCRSHFCYLCSAWLDPSNPYEHFNKPGSSCHQRLWDMEEGDNADGQMQFLGVRGAEMAAALAAELDQQERAEQQAQQAPPAPNVNAAQEGVANLNVNDAVEGAAVEEPDAAAQQAIQAFQDAFDQDFDGWGNPINGPRNNWGFERRPVGQPRNRQNVRPALGGGYRPDRDREGWGDGYGNHGPGRHVRQRRVLRADIEREVDDPTAWRDEGDEVDVPRQAARRPQIQAPRPQAAAQAAIAQVAAQQPRNQADAAAVAVAGLQRFLQMAAEDREDEWDSDEMDEDDDLWAIPDAPPREPAPMGERVLMPFLMARR